MLNLIQYVNEYNVHWLNFNTRIILNIYKKHAVRQFI